jgi:integrase
VARSTTTSSATSSTRRFGRAGLRHLRDKDDPIVHDLLHTFGTLGAAIWPLHDLQGYMGRADIQTAMIYVHHVPNVTAADELSRAVKQAMGVATAAVV